MLTRTRRRPLSYRAAGVHLGTADRWVQELKQMVRATQRAEVIGSLEGFGGLFRLPQRRGQHWLLVASADGAGTKVKLAQLAQRHIGIGVDVVAMNVNDLLTFGAEPLFFLDYLAMGTLNRRVMRELVQGMVRGCRDSGCALLGGETAEMPGCYGPGEYDVAGFAVGIVDRRRLVDGRAVHRGDVVVGLASSGVHANGFSLVRRIFSSAQLQRDRGLLQRLLTPTRIYVRPIRAALHHVRLKAMAHMTGGGLARRLPSLTTHTGRRLRVALRSQSWPVPRIFQLIQQRGHISRDEMHQTFNMGIGFAVVCAPRDANIVQRIVRRWGVASWIIGDVVNEGRQA